MKFIKTEWINLGVVVDYSPSFNGINDTMVGFKETVGNPNEKININEHIDLGEEYWH